MIRIFINGITKLLGIVLMFFAVYYGVVHGASPIVAGLFHLPSFAFVVLGLLGIVLASYQIEVIMRLSWNSLFFSPVKIHGRVIRMEKMLPELAEAYYEKGPAILLEEVKRRKLPPIWQYIARKLEARIPIHDLQILIQDEGKRFNERLFTQIRVLQALATISPAVGMTGTILGLLKLLKELSDFSSLGSNMALAFITALYGLIIGNFIFIPMSNRMNSAREESMQLMSQALGWLDMVAHRKPSGYLNRRDHKMMMG